MFDSRHVRTFAEVVRTGSYAAAARSLGYTQPAISQQMKALERAAGTPLFVRVGRGLQLTDAGQVLARHADGILGAISSAYEQMNAITRLRSGRIRVCGFPSANATLVPSALARITEEHPGIRVELQEAEPPDSLDALGRGDCDLVIAFSYGDSDERPATADLFEVPLLDDPLLVLLPRNHPLARRRTVELPLLAHERWIAGCLRCRGHFVETCARAGFTPDIALTTDDNLAVQSLVAAGAGVAFMPGMVVSCMRHPEIVSRPVTPADHRRVCAYSLTGHQEAPVTRMMLEALRRAASATGPTSASGSVSSGSVPSGPAPAPRDS